MAAALLGCDPHALNRAKTAADTAPHVVDLEICYQIAVKQHAVKVESSKINADFKVCADAADAKAGLK